LPAIHSEVTEQSSNPECRKERQMTSQHSQTEAPIVFFDGVCGFCNHSINWLIVRDIKHRLRFAPLQGSTAQSQLPAQVRQNLDTLVLVSEGRLYTRTAAVSRILMLLGGCWKLAGILLWLVPSPLRDLGYRLVAKVRYRLFGKRDTCRLPTPDERSLFLD
jgi:predicted DCC family thiol-disulfide oxidoreductase YuxK